MAVREPPVNPTPRPGAAGAGHRLARREDHPAAAGHRADQRLGTVALELEGAEGKRAAAGETAGARHPQAAAPAAVLDLGLLAVLQHGQIDLVNRADVLTRSAVDRTVPSAIDGVQTVGTL